jgi:cytoskeletal protein RodZ
MENYLNRLRNKPDHHKRRIALGLSVFFTGLIFVVWLSVLLPQNASRVVAQSGTETKGETPIKALSNGVAQAYDAMKNTINTQKKSLDLQAEYEKMKNQVETGQIKIAPDNTDH